MGYDVKKNNSTESVAALFLLFLKDDRVLLMYEQII